MDLEQLTPPAPSLTREGEEDVEFSVYFTHTDACTPVTWNLHYVIHEMDWCEVLVGTLRMTRLTDARRTHINNDVTHEMDRCAA